MQRPASGVMGVVALLCLLPLGCLRTLVELANTLADASAPAATQTVDTPAPAQGDPTTLNRPAAPIPQGTQPTDGTQKASRTAATTPPAGAPPPPPPPSSPPTPGPGPATTAHESRRTVSYRIDGDTIPALRARMQATGPLDHGLHRFAYTHIEFTWHWDDAPGPNSCAARNITVDTEIVQTYPEWNGGSASPATRREFARWLEATHQHEDGHVAIGQQAEGRIRSVLAAVGPKATCDELSRASDAVAGREVDVMNRNHVEYDRETQHGATTGAALHDVP